MSDAMREALAAACAREGFERRISVLEGKLGAASAMLAALKEVEELFPKAPPPAIAQKATENFRRFQLVRAAIAQAEAAGIKAEG